MRANLVFVSLLLLPTAFPYGLPLTAAAQEPSGTVRLSPELARLAMPSGDGVLLETKSVSVDNIGRIRISLATRGPSSNLTKAGIGRVDALYLTSHANLLRTDSTDVSGPVGIVAMWHKLVSMNTKSGSLPVRSPGTSFDATGAGEPTGGIVNLSVEECAPGKLVVSGTLPHPVDVLAPRAICLVVMGPDGRPISPALWVKLTD